MAGGIELAGVGVELIPGGGGGAVTSVFGRTGAVVAANNDYTIAQIAGLGTGVATALGNTAGGTGGFALVGTTPPTGNAGGDLTGTYPNPTLAAVLTAGGPTGSPTVAPIITYDAKGRLTAVSSATITPAVGSITGLGTGVAAALGNTAGGAGGFALVGTTPPTGTAGGELAGTYPNPTLLNSAVISKVLTGYVSGAGTVAATDSILQAIQKLNGNAVAGPVGTAGGDLTGTYPNPTLAAIVSAGGPTGSATVAPIITYDAKGRLTAVTSATIAPAIGSITGLGTGVATALGVNIGSAGAFVTFNGAAGTPSSMVGTNITGTAAGLTAGTVTTNANLTGDVTSSGNATTLATTQTGAHTWSAAQTYSGGEINSTNGAASAPSKTFTGTLFTGGSATTTFPQMLFQPTGTSAVTTWSTSGTIIGANVVSGFVGNFLDFHVAGAASAFSISSAGAGTFASTVTASTFTGASIYQATGTGTIQWNGRGILSSPAAGSIQLGAADAASPVAQTLRVQSVVAGTSNTAGVNATFIGSLSTGSGLSGDLIFQTGGTGAGTTAQNAATTALTLKGATQQANFAGAVLNRVLVSPKATTPITVASTDSNTYFTNEGASAQIIFNLPTAVANLTYTYFVEDSDGIQVVASAGDTLRIAGSVSATAGNIVSTTIGSSITIVAINATEWVAVAVVGTWVVT